MNETLIDFIETLDSTYRRAVRQAESDSAIESLTTSQLRYIDAIHSLSDPTVSQVAEALDVTSAAATVGLKRLVAMGYATKIRSTQDRRVLHVQLTTSGKRLVAAKEAALKSYGESVRAALSPAETAEFARLVAKLTHHLRTTTGTRTDRQPDRLDVDSVRSGT